MALLLLPVQVFRAEADETKQTDAVCRVVVVALVLTKNILGLLTTTSSVDLKGGEYEMENRKEGMKLYGNEQQE